MLLAARRLPRQGSALLGVPGRSLIAVVCQFASTRQWDAVPSECAEAAPRAPAARGAAAGCWRAPSEGSTLRAASAALVCQLAAGVHAAAARGCRATSSAGSHVARA
jgi:hypothetical protein